MSRSWHDRYVLVVLAVAAVAVIAAVVVLSTGRGGELALFAPVGPGLDLPANRVLDPDDLRGLRLPRRPAGYRTTDVDEVLQWAGNALAERDAKIAVLEQRIAQIYERERARDREAREEARRALHDSEEAW